MFGCMRRIILLVVLLLLLALASWLIFREPPDAWFYLGAPIIIGSGVYIWLRERRLSRTVTVEPVVD